jgi:hypothetical protein
MYCLVSSRAGKNHPVIECSGTTFAASTRFDSHGIRYSLDHVAKADVLVRNETWKAYAVGLAWSIPFDSAFNRFLSHTVTTLPVLFISKV